MRGDAPGRRARVPRGARLGWFVVALGALIGAAPACRTAGTPLAELPHEGPHPVSEVVPGTLYRSGQPTVESLKEAVARYGIRTVINLRAEAPNPLIGGDEPEREFCEALGVRYVHLPADAHPAEIFPSAEHPQRPDPPFVTQFLAIVDDPEAQPVLIHCQGGVHRAGLMTAVYRVTHGTAPHEAYAEMMRYGYRAKYLQKAPQIWNYLTYLSARRDRSGG